MANFHRQNPPFNMAATGGHYKVLAGLFFKNKFECLWRVFTGVFILWINTARNTEKAVKSSIKSSGGHSCKKGYDMIRGTTPTHTFGIPVPETEVKDIRITYTQNEQIVVEKKKDDVSFEQKKVIVDLAQEETFKFTAGILAEIQIRVLTTDGKVLTNNPLTIDVDKSYNEEILA